jgi:hypothetical protein
MLCSRCLGNVTSQRPESPPADPADDWDSPPERKPRAKDDDWDSLPYRKMPKLARFGFIISGTMLGSAALLGVTYVLLGQPKVGIGFWLLLSAILLWLFGSAAIFWSWEKWRAIKQDSLATEFLSRTLLAILCATAAFGLLVFFCTGIVKL